MVPQECGVNWGEAVLRNWKCQIKNKGATCLIRRHARHRDKRPGLCIPGPAGRSVCWRETLRAGSRVRGTSYPLSLAVSSHYTFLPLPWPRCLPIVLPMLLFVPGTALKLASRVLPAGEGSRGGEQRHISDIYTVNHVCGAFVVTDPGHCG